MDREFQQEGNKEMEKGFKSLDRQMAFLGMKHDPVFKTEKTQQQRAETKDSEDRKYSTRTVTRTIVGKSIEEDL